MKKHEPTDRDRAIVKTAAGYGLPHGMISILIGISENTLRLHYREELAVGKATATFEVAKTLYSRATSGNDLGAAIFWLKSQAGWREKHVLDDPVGRKGLAELIALSGVDVPGVESVVSEDAGSDVDPTRSRLQ